MRSACGLGPNQVWCTRFRPREAPFDHAKGCPFWQRFQLQLTNPGHLRLQLAQFQATRCGGDAEHTLGEPRALAFQWLCFADAFPVEGEWL